MGNVRPWRAFSVDIFSHEALRGPDEIVAWLLMIRWARFTDDPENGLKRGQFRITRGELARRLQKMVSKDPHRAKEAPRWTRNRASSFVRRMEDSGSLATTPEGEGPRATTLFTVLNYDKYQQKTRNSSEPVAKRPGTSSETLDRNQNGNLEETGNTNETTGKQSGNTSETHRETGSKRQDLRDKTPARSRVVSDETGTEWPEPSADFEYPASFKTIWADWKAAVKVCKVTANGKLAAYKQIRQHIKAKTLTLAQIQQATGRFLKKHKGEPKLYGAPQPPRFYGKQGDIFEYLTAADESETPESMRERWHNPRDAWRECVSLANHLGVRIPEVPKRAYGAEWEDVEAFHPLVIQYATDRTGFKAVPDDLAGRIQGEQ